MYNILIVEDEQLEMAALTKIVSEHIVDAEIYTASTGRKAINWIDSITELDLLLVDLNIPLPNGLDVIRYLREKNLKTKVIVLTANDDINMACNMFGLQVNNYLLKPIRTSKLLEVLKTTLSIDSEKEERFEENKQEMLTFLENFEYVKWIERITQNLLEDKSVNHSKDLLNTVIRLKGLELEKSAKYNQQLSIMKYDRKNFYNILRTLINMSNDIFDLLHRKNLVKVEPILRAQYHIERHIFDELKLDDVADHTFISSSYLSRLYRKYFGIGFSQYIIERKMALAKILLRYSDLQINQISIELSYNDLNYFCRLFKKVTGKTPSEYRLTEDS
ncbi:AraC family transcriptional regulator [Lonepinella koalarum]|uniref:AraC family two component transcriptional regulator n=1 Tax=Lonepinella koalarum TaxID=53417 RepID=A0A4R1KPL7_9PAST|nr:AraC family transcriptional regulator [Lonepinella koalarum]MDH2926661.1 hypothetical protein [Lonepinella koalarum]TCK66985.1 AraC family two component transcriptional regulator [Lonepinella koalarum]